MVESVPFPNSQMGHELVLARVALDSTRSLLIGTTHLESLDQNTNERLSQLSLCFKTMNDRLAALGSSCHGALLMGDMNLIGAEIRGLDQRLNCIRTWNFQVAPSGRSQCQHCKDKIPKETVRLGIKEQVTLHVGAQPKSVIRWYHCACKASNMEHPIPPKRISGYEYLSRTQQVRMRRLRWRRLSRLTIRNVKAFVDDAFQREKVLKTDKEYGCLDAEELRSAGLPTGWMDLWLDHVQHQAEQNCDISESFTFDGKKNTRIDNRNFQSRLDRMFYRNSSQEDAVSPRVSFRRIGLEPMPLNQGHASDHFGILTELSIPFDLDRAEEQRFASRKRQRTESNGTRDDPIEL